MPILIVVGLKRNKKNNVTTKNITNTLDWCYRKFTEHSYSLLLKELNSSSNNPSCLMSSFMDKYFLSFKFLSLSNCIYIFYSQFAFLFKLSLIFESIATIFINTHTSATHHLLETKNSFRISFINNAVVNIIDSSTNGIDTKKYIILELKSSVDTYTFHEMCLKIN